MIDFTGMYSRKTWPWVAVRNHLLEPVALELRSNVGRLNQAVAGGSKVRWITEWAGALWGAERMSMGGADATGMAGLGRGGGRRVAAQGYTMPQPPTDWD